MRRSWRIIEADDGLGIATETTRWGDDAAVPIVASHATGFCKEVLRPVVAELAQRISTGAVVAADLRAHGDSGTPAFPFDWWDFGKDLVTIAAGRSGLVGVGHSAGGAAVAMAEMLAPGTFRSLVLVEPIVFPGPYVAYEHPLMDRARRRKPWFPSPAEALANFAEKPTLAGWDRRALEAYVRHGLTPGDGGWVLKCVPAAEEETYRVASLHAAWERLGEIRCPVTIVAGEDSDSHPVEIVERMAAEMARATVVVVPRATHMVPMERPDAVADLLAAAVMAGDGPTDPHR